MGARPDGWWRDRPAALRRLHGALAAFARDRGEEVVMVLDAPVPGLADAPGVRVVSAPRTRRDAADDEVVRVVAASAAPGGLRVATSDAALAARVAALGARVEGAGAFRRRLGS